MNLKTQVAAFRVFAVNYLELEAEADQITRDLNTLANDSVIDTAAIRDLENALQVKRLHR